jgi:hypothetical protein
VLGGKSFTYFRRLPGNVPMRLACGSNQYFPEFLLEGTVMKFGDLFQVIDYFIGNIAY